MADTTITGTVRASCVCDSRRRKSALRDPGQRGGRVGECDREVPRLLDHPEQGTPDSLVVVDDHDLARHPDPITSPPGAQPCGLPHGAGPSILRAR
jgi:hypothetical protein